MSQNENNPQNDPSLEAALELVQHILDKWAAEKQPEARGKMHVLLWGLTDAGPRVAEVGWTSDDRRSGWTFMQGDVPWGLAVCAQVERVLITEMYLEDSDETENEVGRLLWLLNQEREDG